MTIDFPSSLTLVSEPRTLWGYMVLPSIFIPFFGSIPLSGTSTQPCSECNGDGMIDIERERRLDELYDEQIKSLFEAEQYRKNGDKNKKRSQERMMRQARGANIPGPSPPARP